MIRGLAILAVWLAAYVGSYIAFSAAGGWYWSQTGTRRRYDLGLAISDVVRWHPAWLRWEPFCDIYGQATSRGNLPGYLYSPLIRLDRRWFHPDRNGLPEDPPTQPATKD